MDCDRVQTLLNAFVDGELDLVTSLDVEEHLKDCANCAREQQWLEALHSAASQRALYHPAPDHLEKRIQAALKRASPPAPRPAVFSWRWLAPAALVIVALFVIGLFASGWRLNSQKTLLAQDVQAAHVRSLMANHLTDVTSTDQHTVKPWFDGKLDFSPPVVDLASQGFPLVGGRLDYLDGRPVAALVYRRSKHEINLFIWPTTEKNGPVQASTDNGYNISHWNQAGMTFWAVSDLNPTELQMFVEIFQKAAH